jgi:hypothetical protein
LKPEILPLSVARRAAKRLVRAPCTGDVGWQSEPAQA